MATMGVFIMLQSFSFGAIAARYWYNDPRPFSDGEITRHGQQRPNI